MGFSAAPLSHLVPGLLLVGQQAASPRQWLLGFPAQCPVFRLPSSDFSRPLQSAPVRVHLPSSVFRPVFRLPS
eukprot:4099153-Prymnesium_polylepis.1